MKRGNSQVKCKYLKRYAVMEVLKQIKKSNKMKGAEDSTTDFKMSWNAYFCMLEAKKSFTV